ncbi:hypothetical protein EYF80_041645 [Liparis tanakae]|uniref:Uncharacterized protein n=1 Tax=Liparis tanakae TaxID=230148 RepID=A0A4Z2G513_9TELE|nr:hypothetical protein EYF80_041645 [Liparis tanakae]
MMRMMRMRVMRQSAQLLHRMTALSEVLQRLGPDEEETAAWDSQVTSEDLPLPVDPDCLNKIRLNVGTSTDSRTASRLTETLGVGFFLRVSVSLANQDTFTPHGSQLALEVIIRALWGVPSVQSRAFLPSLPAADRQADSMSVISSLKPPHGVTQQQQQQPASGAELDERR